MKIAINPLSQYNRISEFRDMADKVSALAARQGVTISGYHSPDLPLYHALSLDKQTEALRLLRLYLESLETAEAMGGSLDAQGRSVWGALSRIRLVPPSDLFSRLKPDTLIEIYDLYGLQLWRNFTFMKFCSYTIEEIYAIEWFNRYSRDEDKTAACLAKVGELLSGKTPDILVPDVPAHLLEETCSQDRLIFEARYELLSTLKNNDGQIAAWLVMTSAEIVGRGKSPRKPELRVAAEPGESVSPPLSLA